MACFCGAKAKWENSIKILCNMLEELETGLTRKRHGTIGQIWMVCDVFSADLRKV